MAAATSHDASDWLMLRDKLWAADDHAREIEQYFSGQLIELVEVLIARDQAGYAVAHVELSIRHDLEELEGVKTGYIEGLYVDPEHRRTGLVQRLLRESERWASSVGCQAFASDRNDRVIVHRRYVAPAV
nr:GNAT family N-acetyltransferase [Pseudomonas aeruginosa]